MSFGAYSVKRDSASHPRTQEGGCNGHILTWDCWVVEWLEAVECMGLLFHKNANIYWEIKLEIEYLLFEKD